MPSISVSSTIRVLPGKSTAFHSKLEQLYKTMNELRKQLRALYDQLENAGTPLERMRLREEIRARENMLETLRREIIFLLQARERALMHKTQQTAPDHGAASPGYPEVADPLTELYRAPYELGPED